jgi:hypothetical protein
MGLGFNMTEHKNIYSALCAAQAEFGKVQKGSTNPAFKSRYADLADVAGVVIPTLSAHGVAVLHYMVGEGDAMAMRTEFVHANSESRVSCDVPLIVDRNNMQGMKSATTYAKRIGLESLSGVAPDTDDDGNAAAKAPPKQEQRQQKPQEPDAEAIQKASAYLAEADSLDDLKERWGRIPKPVQAIADVIAAKDAAKERLSKPIIDDEIPY